MQYIRALPLLAVAVAAYFLVTMAGTAALATPALSLHLPSSAEWVLTAGDLVIAGGLGLLFIEVIKSTRFSTVSMADHALSILLLALCLVLFVVLPMAGTSVFFLLLLMTLIDVMAGFLVTVSAARRDVAFGPVS